MTSAGERRLLTGSNVKHQALKVRKDEKEEVIFTCGYNLNCYFFNIKLSTEHIFHIYSEIYNVLARIRFFYCLFYGNSQIFEKCEAISIENL